MHANIGRRSNVVVIGGRHDWDSPEFSKHIRGCGALIKWLERKAPAWHEGDALVRYLSPRQRAEITARCHTCGAYPEGPVRGRAGIEIEFRCPRGKCTASHHVARTVLLRKSLLDAAMSLCRDGPSAIVQRALSHETSAPALAPAAKGDEIQRITVRLTPSQYLAYRHHTDSELSQLANAAIASWVNSHGRR